MLNKLAEKIEAVMKSPGGEDRTVSERSLGLISELYGGVTGLRAKLYKRDVFSSNRLPCKVISVGNLTVGGTGKTPMVIYIARELHLNGKRPVIVSRGYGGSASAAGGVVSDGENLLLSVDEAGDEPYMMAKKLLSYKIPVVIGSNRHEAGMRAVEQFNPDLIILDDGYQHLKVERDLNILLCDAHAPFGNGRMMPRGTLREPVSAIERADMVVLTRSDSKNRAADIARFEKAAADTGCGELIANTPVFTASHSSSINDDLENFPSNVFAFSGIAKNEAFRKTVKERGFFITGFNEFPDHYFYAKDDLKQLAAEAEASGAEALITTEKDYVKLAGKTDPDLPVIVIGIDIDFGEDRERFHRLLNQV